MLKLTDFDSGIPVYINPTQIVSFITDKPDSDATQIVTTAVNGWYSVKESPEYINKMINDIFGMYL